MSQTCKLCNGSGRCWAAPQARCFRCDGEKTLPDDFDQSKPTMQPYRCGTCGGVHEMPDNVYSQPCPNETK